MTLTTEMRSGTPAEAAVVARPWPGLDAFDELLTPYFFGRAVEVDELFRLVRRDLATLFFGQSGLGKTSLLQAGLFPRLRRAGFLPVLIRLDYSAGAPTAATQVRAAVDHEIALAGIAQSASIGPEESLWGWLHRADRRLADAAGAEIIPVLVFDQFEEIFTQGLVGPARADSQSFLGELAELIENRPPAALQAAAENDPDIIEHYGFDRQDYRALLTLREDFLAPLESLRGRAPSLGRNRFRLRRMTDAQALDAILNPVPGLVPVDVAHEIVRFLGNVSAEDAFGAGAGRGFEVEPSLLSLVCSELNERRLSRGLDRIGAELLAGTRDDIIADFYERSLADQPEPLRVFIEEKLLSDSGFRESLTLDGARRALRDAGVTEPVLDELVRRRLLRIEERLEVARIEIIHDVLIPVIRRSRETRRLRQAEAQAAEHAAALRRERQRARRAWAAAAAMALLLLGCIGLAGLAWQNSRAAERARADATENLALASRVATALFFQLDEIAETGEDTKLASAQIEHALSLAKGLWPDGNPLLAVPDTKEALTTAQEVRALFQSLLRASPDDATWQYDLATANTYVAGALAAQNRFREAAAEQTGAISMTEALAARSSNTPMLQAELALRTVLLGGYLREQGNKAEALAAYRKASAIADTVADREPDNANFLAFVRMASVGRAHTALDLGRPEEAVAADRVYVAAARRFSASTPGDAGQEQLVNALGNLSFMLLVNQQPQEALQQSEAAHELSPSLVWVESNRAHALLFLGRFEEARAIYLANKNKQEELHQKTFAQAIEADFTLFREHGIDLPDMKRIEALYASH